MTRTQIREGVCKKFDSINEIVWMPQIHVDITDALELYTLDSILLAITHEHPEWRFNRTEKSVWDDNGVIAVFDFYRFM